VDWRIGSEDIFAIFFCAFVFSFHKKIPVALLRGWARLLYLGMK
jgi:hypothetical protein